MTRDKQMVRIVAPECYRSMPWRNGLGSTVELIRQDLPEGEGFAWRISMADVTQDGAFSNFAGYDRCLLLLEGNGITLQCSAGQHFLQRPLQAAHFSGDDETVATLTAGPIRDFNVMTHRRFCTARVTSCENTQGETLDIDANVVLIYAVDGDVQVNAASLGHLTIPQKHLLIADNPARELLVSQGAATIAVQICHNSD